MANGPPGDDGDAPVPPLVYCLLRYPTSSAASATSATTVPLEGKAAHSTMHAAAVEDSKGLRQLLTSFHHATNGFVDEITNMRRRQFCFVRLSVKSCGAFESRLGRSIDSVATVQTPLAGGGGHAATHPRRNHVQNASHLPHSPASHHPAASLLLCGVLRARRPPRAIPAPPSGTV